MNARKYLILTTRGAFGSLNSNYFSTYKEAEKFAMTLNFNVPIYRLAAEVTIHHKVEKLTGGGDE